MREVNQSPSASRLISGTKYSSRSPSSRWRSSFDPLLEWGVSPFWAKGHPLLPAFAVSLPDSEADSVFFSRQDFRPHLDLKVVLCKSHWLPLTAPAC